MTHQANAICKFHQLVDYFQIMDFEKQSSAYVTEDVSQNSTVNLNWKRSIHWKRHLAMKTYVWALRRLDPYTWTKHHHPPTTRTHLQLRSVPMAAYTGMSHFLLQLEDAIHQSLARRRTARHVDIDWHNTITAPRHAVGVMVVTATVRTTAHGYDPSWFGHLIIDLS